MPTAFRQLRLKLFFIAHALFEKMTGVVVTFRTRPLYSKNVTHVADAVRHMPRCAIVLQGGLMKKYDFTLETVRIYKKVYPALTVIVSTWDDEDPTYLAQLRDAGADVVLSKKPEYFGTWNINLQIVSTKNGILRAKELGIPYTIKSRADQRMYERSIVETLFNLLSHFPPAGWAGLRKRIIVCPRAYKYYAAYLPDMFMFGDTDDLLEYWSASLLKKEARYAGFLSELYLTYSFCKRKGWPVPNSIQAMWNIYRDCVVILDWNDVDLLWPKYDYFWDNHYTRHERYSAMTLEHKFIDLSFNEWFNIFSDAGKAPSAAQEEKFAHFLKAANFSDYEHNYEHQGGNL